jgi:hypothetical protein
MPAMYTDTGPADVRPMCVPKPWKFNSTEGYDDAFGGGRPGRIKSQVSEMRGHNFELGFKTDLLVLAVASVILNRPVGYAVMRFPLLFTCGCLVF